MAVVAALVGAMPAAEVSARPVVDQDPGRLTPEVTTMIGSLGPGEMATVVVQLRERADLDAVRGGSGRVRARRTVEALRATADSSQRPLRARLRTQVARGEVSDVTPLWVVNGVSVTASADVIRELATRPDVASVVADDITLVPSAGAPEPNQQVIGAPEVWGLGQTGQGVVVAGLDSGVDVSHPDLAGRWRGGTNSWFDPYGQHPTTPTDLSGHGTATMGAMVGGDAGGTSIGTSPGATWIAAKIFDDAGGATATAVHQAFQWVLDPDGDPGTADAPHVVNGSWSLGSGPGCDPSFRPDLAALRAAGILPVFAAGNFGAGGSTSVSPANYPEALAVGAVANSGLVYAASSRGPSTCAGRARVFPDLVAPGVDVLTAERYGLYQVASGTSMSAPHVSGALALLLGAVPGLTVDQQQAALTGTALDLGPPGPDAAYGTGRLDVLAAYQWVRGLPTFGVELAAAVGSVPVGGRATYEVRVTPVNGFSADVSLVLSGLSPSQAGWSFTPSVVTGGAGTAVLEVATTSAIAPGSHPLAVTASSGTMHRTGTASLTVTAPPAVTPEPAPPPAADPPRSAAGPGPDFSLSASRQAVTVVRGRAVRVRIRVAAEHGFTGSVRLSRSGKPPRSSARWSRRAVVVPGGATLRVRTARATPRGTYTLVVRGRSGSVRHRVPVTLTVRGPRRR